MANKLIEALADESVKCFIFDSKGSEFSSRDVEYKVYRWNKKRHNKVEVGDIFIYRRPTNSSEDGKFYFYGAGQIGSITGDYEKEGHVINPMVFPKRITQDDLLTYKWQWKERKGDDWQQFFSNYGMNEIPRVDLSYILNLSELTSNEEELETISEIIQTNADIDNLDFSADDAISLSKRRKKHAVFADKVKTNYDYACAICGIKTRSFIRAAHILGWSICKTQRLNPANGLCLCTHHDVAFEKKYIMVGDDYKVILNKELIDDPKLYKTLKSCDNKKLKKPKSGAADKRFLRAHREGTEDKIDDILKEG